MSDIANIVFDYFVANQANDGLLEIAEILPNIYGEIKSKGAIKHFVRIADVAGSKPDLNGQGNVQQFNAALPIEIFVRVEPPYATPEELEAREDCNTLADEVCVLIFADRHFADTSGSICEITEIKQRVNGWGKKDGVKHAMTAILLTINPDGS